MLLTETITTLSEVAGTMAQVTEVQSQQQITVTP